MGLIVLSPLLLSLCLVIKLNDPGPIFYRARRIGKGGQPFELYKFRTMIVNADKQGAAISIHGDTRVTPIGKFLRRTKLDELPQLLNVLTGQMSLVGPRPEDPCYVALYTPAQRRILDVAPGITSAASLVYRNEQALLTGADWETIYRTEIMPAKIAIDLNYLKTANVVTDITLIFRTIFSVFS